VTTTHYLKRATAGMILCVLPLGMASAQDEPPITNKQYNELKEELAEMRAEIRRLTSENGTVSQPQAPKPPVRPIETDETAGLRHELRLTNNRLDDLEQQAIARAPGETGFLLTGFAYTLLKVPDEGDSTISTSFSPILLWKLGDRFLFEAELELGLDTVDGRAETSIDLEYANLQYLVNDYVTVGVGKFLTPFGLFSERLHPAWINKLPNAPLVRGHDGLAPSSSIGAFVRGAIPIDKQRINYAVYFVNGPTMVDAERDPEEFGFLDFEGFSGNKAVGGRLGYLPFPQLELGASFIYGEANSDNGLDANSFVVGFDATYILDTDPGLFDFRFEYVYSTVDDVIFDADGMNGVGPIQYNNERQGLYAQAAFRPIHAESKFLKNLEFVGRYDYLSLPEEVHGGGNRKRWTLGVNYWFAYSTVLKVAIDDTKLDGEDNQQNLWVMVAVGF